LYSDDLDRTAKLIAEMPSFGISLKPIKFRHSRADYNMEKETNSIYKGVQSLKYLNAEVSNKLYEMKDMQFDNFIDFLKVSPLNSRQLSILVELNYFEEFGKTQKLLRIVDLYNKYGGKKQIKKDKCDIPEEIISKYSTQTAAMYKLTDVEGMLRELIIDIPDKDIPLRMRLQSEQEYLGYVSLTIPNNRNLAVILDADFKYSPKVKCYMLSTGQQITAKITKKLYTNFPFQNGDVLSIKTEQRPKWKKDEEGEWVQDASLGYDTWITRYSIVENI
jgi:DNA polymerase III alpha subunit